MIRRASPDDAPALAAIYAHHVLHGVATFDLEPPPAAWTAAKIDASLDQGWPFLVEDDAGTVTGYAYANQFRDRPAYARLCEDSIYIHPDRVGQGVGTRLLAALIDASEAHGFRQMVAVIGGAAPASIALHARAGFRETGRIGSAGWKFNRWLDVVYMQRELGEGDRTAPE